MAVDWKARPCNLRLSFLPLTCQLGKSCRSHATNNTGPGCVPHYEVINVYECPYGPLDSRSTSAYICVGWGFDK